MYKMFFRVSAVFFIMVFIVSCAPAESGAKFGTGTLKQPVQNLNPTPSNKNFDVFVDLPLLLWQSFGYARIAKNSRTKVEHCTITESEGTQLQIGAKVEVLDEARCLYILLKANDGRSLPYGNGYSITLNQIRLVETGEVGWTWSRSIEFDNK